MKKSMMIIVIIAGVFLLFLTAFAISSAFAHPNPNPYESYSPIPTPKPCPSPSSYKEITTGSIEGNFSSIGGMDSANGLTAAGDLAAPTTIRIHDGESWSSLIVDFNPSGIEWSGKTASSIYISDNLNNSIFFSTDPMAGSEWVIIGTPGSEIGQFRNPNGMYSGQNNELYVVDTDNNRIQLWNGVGWLPFNSPPESIYMIDICRFGETVFISDYIGHCIYIKGPADTDWHRITDKTHLNYPSYMDVDGDGNLYILSRVSYPDGFRKSIVRYSDGQFYVCIGSGDGPGFISNNHTSEELCINNHNNLIYPDPMPIKIYQELCDVNKIHTFVINGISVDVPPSVHEVFHSVGPETTSVLIEALKVCPFSSVNGEGIFPLPSGTSQYPFVCTSESGIPAQYYLNITKEAEPEPSPSPEISASPSPSPSPEPSAPPSPTPTPSPTPVPTSTPVPTPTQSPVPTVTPAQTATPTPTEAPTSTPMPSQTTVPTPSSEPSATPTLTAAPGDDDSADSDLVEETAEDLLKKQFRRILFFIGIGVVVVAGGGIFAGIMIGKRKK